MFAIKTYIIINVNNYSTVLPITAKLLIVHVYLALSYGIRYLNPIYRSKQ